MIRFLSTLLLILFVASCSFNKNSSFWTKSKKISREKQKIIKVLFKDEKVQETEFNPNLKINLKEKVKIVIGDIEIYADYEKDVDRTTSAGKASAVHFLHFKFNDELVEAFNNKENIIQIGIDHEAYGHLSIVSDRVREELAKEFI